MKLYNGFWFPGTTGFIGRSHVSKNYNIKQSKTLFSIPGWFPFWKYAGIGFQKHVPRINPYNPKAIDIILQSYKIQIRYYDDMEDPQTPTFEGWAMGEIDVNLPGTVGNINSVPIITAYTLEGDYVGDLAKAWMLKGMGITNPKLSHNRGGTVCNIGYSKKYYKWYGWSHRAIYGFAVGSTVKKGDCAYTPTDLEDFMEDCTRFWSDEDRVNINTVICDEPDEYGDNVVYTTWKYSNTIPNKKLHNTINGVHTRIPDEYGRGEWTAQSMEDAKQMAIDFANGVS
tara:strand:+ start:493 stop:1344 length:852 start_codon:yes stop_codon:yes gene_type:complete